MAGPRVTGISLSQLRFMEKCRGHPHTIMVPAADQADSRSAKPECTGSGLFNFQKTCKHGGYLTQVKRKVTVVIQDICIATVIRALENVPGV